MSAEKSRIYREIPETRLFYRLGRWVMRPNRRVVGSKNEAMFRSPAPQRLETMCYNV